MRYIFICLCSPFCRLSRRRYTFLLLPGSIPVCRLSDRLYIWCMFSCCFISFHVLVTFTGSRAAGFAPALVRRLSPARVRLLDALTPVILSRSGSLCPILYAVRSPRVLVTFPCLGFEGFCSLSLSILYTINSIYAICNMK